MQSFPVLKERTIKTLKIIIEITYASDSKNIATKYQSG